MNRRSVVHCAARGISMTCRASVFVAATGVPTEPVRSVELGGRIRRERGIKVI